MVDQLSEKFGKQCVVVSIDSKKNKDNEEYVSINRGSIITSKKTIQWAKEAEEYGSGELFINSIDHDGNRKGYNISLVKQIVDNSKIPIVCMGGVLSWSHFSDGIKFTNADAFAAANIFHYTEHSTKKAKKFLLNKNYNFRPL